MLTSLRPLLSVLLLTLLLQSWAEAGHHSDLAAHQGLDSCSACVTGSASGGALPPSTISLPPARIIRHRCIARTALQPLPATPFLLPGQRDPPVS